MGCCGGGSRSIRKQTVPKATKKAAKQARVQRVSRTNKKEISRQYVVPRQTCPKCGYPSMLVNIANRERNQCSNANCRFILQ
jgi:hypothetical protein